MKTEKSLWVGLVAVAILALVAIALPKTIVVQPGSSQVDSSQPSFGGVTNYDEVDATALRIGGSSSSRLGFLASASCSLIAPSFTVAASTTVSMDCAVTGVASGDRILAQFATSTVAGNGWDIVGASASTTGSFVTLRVTNWTGASNIIPASLASSTQVWVARVRSTIPGL